jgi:hypothetical protein
LEKKINSDQYLLLFVGGGLIVAVLTALMFGVADQMRTFKKRKKDRND